MSTITLIESDDPVLDLNGVDMNVWGQAGNVANIILAVFGDNSPTELYYDTGVAVVIAEGTFGNFNGDGDPTTGTITAFAFLHVDYGALVITGVSLSVPLVFDWIFHENSAALHAAIYDVANDFTGTAFDDRIIAYGGNDVINGGDGHDFLYGDSGPFVFFPAPAGDDTLNGGAGNDFLDGGGGNDILNGDAGDDTILAAGGIDTIDGGDGIDSVTFDRSAVSSVISMNVSTFAATGTFYDGSTVQNVENISVISGSGADVFTIDSALARTFALNAGAGTDRLVINLAAGNTQVVFSASSGLLGSWNVSVGGVAVSVSNFEEIHASGGSANDVLGGAFGNDVLSGGGGNDTLDGGFGSDTLNGGDGNDILRAGEGTDTVNGGAGDDDVTYVDSAGDQIDGGDGVDTISFGFTGATGLNISATTFGAGGFVTPGGATLRNFERIGNSSFGSGADTLTLTTATMAGFVYNGGDGADRIIVDLSGITQTLNLSYSTGAQDFDVTGNGLPFSVVSFDDFEEIEFTGGSGNDTLTGGAGNDTLNGGDGNDRIEDNSGSNILRGGAGDDRIITTIQQPVGGGGLTPGVIDGGDGVDHVQLDSSSDFSGIVYDSTLFGSNTGQTLADGTVIRNVERLWLFAGSGNDTFRISGPIAAGAVQNPYALDGGDGTDTFIGDFSTLTDSVQMSGADFSGGARITIAGAVLVFGAEVVQVTGGLGNDSLVGTTGNDTLIGGGGSDTIDGRGGNDSLSGGAGDDFITSTDSGATSSEVLDGGDGFDRLTLQRFGVTTAMNFTIAALGTAQGVTLSDGTVIRNFESFSLGLGLGDDTVTADSSIFLSSNSIGGGGGTDRFIMDLSTESRRVELAGTALLVVSLGSIVVSFDAYTLTTGSGNDSVQGGDGNDVLSTGTGNDSLFGGEGNDLLNGGAGDDTVWGGQGVDTLTGGLGNDLYDVDNLGDLTIEAADEGIDTVQARLSWALGANIENLYLLGYNQQLNGTGNALNNEIRGNVGNNVLSGLEGNDTFFGDEGNDTLIGGAGIDVSRHDLYGLLSTNASWHRNLDGTWTVTSAEGVDTLSSVEILDFTNRDVVLDNAQQTFFGNGGSDLLWRNTITGAVAIWDMNGSIQVSATIAGGAPTNWQIAGSGDFNGDGRDDFLWRNTDDGGVAAWLQNGATSISQAMIGGAPLNWDIAGIGDFNFDGRDDLLWRNSDDGGIAIWLQGETGLSSQNQGMIGGAPTAWNVAAVADFDGDGRDDILLRHDDGTLARWTTDGVSQTSAAIVGGAPTEWTVAGTGDFDGDTRADIVLHNQNTGAIAIWRMDGNTQAGAAIIGAAPLEWSVAQIGDFNGDGRDDLLLRHDDGTVAFWMMNGFAIDSIGFYGLVPNDWRLD